MPLKICISTMYLLSVIVLDKVQSDRHQVYPLHPYNHTDELSD